MKFKKLFFQCTFISSLVLLLMLNLSVITNVENVSPNLKAIFNLALADNEFIGPIEDPEIPMGQFGVFQRCTLYRPDGSWTSAVENICLDAIFCPTCTCQFDPCGG